MNENDLLTSYCDVLEETDDPALLAVARGLHEAYLPAGPTAEVRSRIRRAVAASAAPSNLQPGSRRHRYLRRPLALIAAVAVAGSFAGGATYAMKGSDLFSGPT